MNVSDQDDSRASRITSAGVHLRDERQHFQGKLGDFSVLELCHILIQGGKSGQLLLFLPEEEELHAYIYFSKGQFVHAKYRFAPDDIRQGDAVLGNILQMKEGTFDFIFDKPASAITIQGDSMSLLMDACHKADEANRMQ